MNIINLFNYKIYITKYCYNFLLLNKKKKYKIFVKNKGKIVSKTILCYNKSINLFYKIIKIKKVFLIIDLLSLCFLNNSCLHFKKTIIINSPCSNKNFFLENKILNKIIFLFKFIINKKLILHGGFLKICCFNFIKKKVFISFFGNCANCNISKFTLKNFVIKILKKIKFLKKIIIL